MATKAKEQSKVVPPPFHPTLSLRTPCETAKNFAPVSSSNSI